MQLKPVKKYFVPSYPTRDWLDEHPELLRLVPRRWRNNAAVLALLGGVFTLVVACRAQTSSGKVAPIFIHGSGAGGVTGGLVGYSTPSLSEEEARQIIWDEAAKAGLAFVSESRVFHDVPVPTGRTYAELPDTIRAAGDVRPDSLRRIPEISTDAVDAKHHILYDYVSERETGSLSGSHSDGAMGSWWSARLSAEMVRYGFSHTRHAETIGIFYDPKSSPRSDLPAAKDSVVNGMRPSERDLRAQVRDFIAWLKAEGII